MSEELVKSGENQLAIADLLFEDAGRGSENVGQGDKATPFLRILQSKSPEVEDGEKQIVGARAGMLMNSVTGEVIEARATIDKVDRSDTGILVVNAAFVPKVTIWGAERSGWKGNKDINSPEYLAVKAANLRNDKDKLVDAEGNVWEPTAYHALVSLEGPAICPMAASNSAASRAWNTALDKVRLPRPDGNGNFAPPRYGLIWRLQTYNKAFKKGSCYVYKATLVGAVTDPAFFKVCKAFNAAVLAGEIDILKPPVQDESSPDGGDRADLPF